MAASEITHCSLNSALTRVYATLQGCLNVQRGSLMAFFFFFSSQISASVSPHWCPPQDSPSIAPKPESRVTLQSNQLEGLNETILSH